MGNWTKDLCWWRTRYVIYSFEGLGAVINITVVVLVGVCIKSSRAILSLRQRSTLLIRLLLH